MGLVLESDKAFLAFAI